MQVVTQFLPRLVQAAGLGLRPEKALDGHAELVVPVFIETSRQLFGHRAGTEQVDVGEVHRLVRLEVLVAKVASADDRQAAVDQHQLVVHAPVLQRQVQQPSQGASDSVAAADMQRIEYSNLDVGVRRERRDPVVMSVAGGVVQQQAHAYAAIGGLQQFVDQRPRGQAVMDDVVLHVQAELGRADHLAAGGERLGALGKQAKARVAVRMVGGELLDPTAER